MSDYGLPVVTGIACSAFAWALGFGIKAIIEALKQSSR